MRGVRGARGQLAKNPFSRTVALSGESPLCSKVPVRFGSCRFPGRRFVAVRFVRRFRFLTVLCALGSVRFGSRKPESPKHTEALMFWTLLICFDSPKLFLEGRFPGLDPPNVQVSRFGPRKRAGFQVWTPQTQTLSFGLGTLRSASASRP